MANTPMWFWLDNLPAKYWCEGALKWIGEEMRSLVEIDMETLNNSNRSSARICVVTDLDARAWEELEILSKGSIWKQRIRMETFPRKERIGNPSCERIQSEDDQEKKIPRE
ncbi:hypothetical protein SUGI_0761710 [Cryptomeria japonica]|nr:hypothetical protein SUGI_0761710 [Cryptomeria japonica]